MFSLTSNPALPRPARGDADRRHGLGGTFDLNEGLASTATKRGVYVSVTGSVRVRAEATPSGSCPFEASKTGGHSLGGRHRSYRTDPQGGVWRRRCGHVGNGRRGGHGGLAARPAGRAVARVAESPGRASGAAGGGGRGGAAAGLSVRAAAPYRRRGGGRGGGAARRAGLPAVREALSLGGGGGAAGTGGGAAGTGGAAAGAGGGAAGASGGTGGGAVVPPVPRTSAPDPITTPRAIFPAREHRRRGLDCRLGRVLPRRKAPRLFGAGRARKGLEGGRHDADSGGA